LPPCALCVRSGCRLEFVGPDVNRAAHDARVAWASLIVLGRVRGVPAPTAGLPGSSAIV
jgi:hypothetical protein